jgi:xanthine dehydrogenase accessory factor
MKSNWSAAIDQMSQQGKGYVIATLIGVSGSTPRNSGSKMVITKEGIYDTIGGGHLEHKVIKFANDLLLAGETCQRLAEIDLGIHLDQCCGGGTNILFECFAETKVNIILFGAGHVGKALLPVLATLPCQITWIDSRESQFPDVLSSYSNIKKIVSDKPQDDVANMPENSYYIVMTHKHQMDFDICLQVMSRNDFRYLGLIGSETKWRRFQRRFSQQGITNKQLERVKCPVGLSEVAGKLPVEIAISIAAEIIADYNKKLNSGSNKDTIINHQLNKKLSQGVNRKTIKQLIENNENLDSKHTINNLVKED